MNFDLRNVIVNIKRLILAGSNKKEMTRDDMWPIEESETCQVLTDQLEKEWIKATKRFFFKFKK